MLPDYYEVLGVSRKAKLTDINRAYNRWVADFRKESTPPDPRREALLAEAHAILSDEERRDAYDREYAAGHAERRGPSKKPVMAIAAGLAVVVAAVGAYLALRTATPSGPRARTAEDLLATMSGSVSPLETYDISGKISPAGMGFVIQDKLMVANCQALAPGVQLMVKAGPRSVPARVTLVDEGLGLCKIITDGYVGEPLSVNTTPPAVGVTVFAAGVGPKGAVTLSEAKVKRVMDVGKGKAIEAAIPGQPGRHGAPLIDAQGRVVAVATLQPDGQVLHRIVPAAWLAENRPVLAEPKPYQDSGAPAAGAGAGTSADPTAAMLQGQKPANWEEMGADEREQWERGQAEIQRRQGAIIKGMSGKK